MSDPIFNWLNKRSAGALLHISSLPSETGIGNLGSTAYKFIDFLEAAGLSVWQICPLGPTGYGDSPYQCFSSFAGNPYFIDLKPLVDEGLLENTELDTLRALPEKYVDYGALYKNFWPVLRQAYDRFKASGADHFSDYGSFKDFRKKHYKWIEYYALFIALKSQFGSQAWLKWPSEFRDCKQALKQPLSDQTLKDVEAHVFYQYLFFRQLEKLRNYAKTRGVQIFGDVPLFVALDSADVWANPTLFQLKKDGSPKAVAGVPPDYFSEDGQLWGNPLYDWKAHQKTKFAWWIERIKANIEFYDIVRLDHFRGFESYWSVPAGEKTARKGKWMPSPGAELFQAIQKHCPDAKLVAENLGVITDKVKALIDMTGLPGMSVLHFAFSDDSANPYLLHNSKRNTVVYSGTHDNDTTLGWYQQLDETTQDHIRRYLSVSGNYISWDLIRAAIQSTANMAIFPLQDLMSLGSEARFNTPGTATGNWKWRYLTEHLDTLQSESAFYLRELLRLYGRDTRSKAFLKENSTSR